MKKVIIGLMFLMLVSPVFAETYTGKAEKIVTNDRGVTFEVVVKNSKNTEVYRREVFVSTGVITGEQAKDALKNVVDRTTQDIYAHIEGAKIVKDAVVVLETYQATCDAFVVTADRPSPEDVRP